MKDSHNTRLVLLLAAGAICIVSAFAIESGDNRDSIAEPQLRNEKAEKDGLLAKSESPADAKPLLSLSLDKLTRSGSELNTRPKADDLFPPSTWIRTPPPAPTVAPPPPPAPTAPPLPFNYMGKFTEPSGKTVVYLGQGDKALTVSAGETIDSTYRVESIDNAQLTFIYLPLNIKQALLTGNSP